MKRVILASLAAGTLAAAPAQAQDGATVFRPSGGWTADYGDDYCRLIRTFSDGSNDISLAFQRTQPGAPVRLILVGDAIKTFRSADQIGYALLPSGPSAKARYVRATTADGQQYLNFDPIFLATPAAAPAGDGPPVPPPYDRAAEQQSARGINAISLTDGLTAPVRIETESLRAPIAALQTCADDLLRTWGLDPDKHKAMTAPAVLNPRSDGVLPQDTIPFTEFDKLNGGANAVRLLVGADGKPTSCTVYSPSLTRTMNEKICGLAMERASFQPAKDADGQAMASYWMGSPLLLGPPFGRGR